MPLIVLFAQGGPGVVHGDQADDQWWVERGKPADIAVIEEFLRVIHDVSGVDGRDAFGRKLANTGLRLNIVRSTLIESILGGPAGSLEEDRVAQETRQLEAARALERWYRELAAQRALGLLRFARGVVLLPVAFRDP